MASAKPKVTLYWLEKSRSHRILWLLEELKVDYELKTFKRGKDMLAGPELKEIHPLGKSPVISVDIPGREKPMVVAESGDIVEFICENYGSHLIPQKYQVGKENQIGGETESWLRYRYFMHYAEGSLMSLLIAGLLTERKQQLRYRSPNVSAHQLRRDQNCTSAVLHQTHHKDHWQQN